MKLHLENREQVRKGLKNLRENGFIPSSIYGPKLDSKNVKVDAKEFKNIFEQAGYSKFIDVQIGEDKKHYKVLVKDVFQHPIKDFYFDVQFYAVDEESKITVDVPVELTGESPAVKQKLGFLMTPITTVAVHCLPKDLPEKLEYDLSALAQPGDTISVGAVDLAEGVEFDSSMDETSAIAFISAPQKEVIEDDGADSDEENENGEGESVENTEETAE